MKISPRTLAYLITILVCIIVELRFAQVSEEDVMQFRKAAEQGEADAQYNLGVCYYNGDGVPQDEVLAYMWYDLASANGLKRAERKKGQLEKRLTRQQITEAQKLSREWKPKGQ